MRGGVFWMMRTVNTNSYGVQTGPRKTWYQKRHKLWTRHRPTPPLSPLSLGPHDLSSPLPSLCRCLCRASFLIPLCKQAKHGAQTLFFSQCEGQVPTAAGLWLWGLFPVFWEMPADCLPVLDWRSLPAHPAEAVGVYLLRSGDFSQGIRWSAYHFMGSHCRVTKDI